MGFALTFWRILRCNPFSPFGHDPVPEKGFKTMPLRWSKYDPPAQTEEISRVDADETTHTDDTEAK